MVSASSPDLCAKPYSWRRLLQAFLPFRLDNVLALRAALSVESVKITETSGQRRDSR